MDKRWRHFASKNSPRQQHRQAQQKTDEQARVHPRQQRVVTQVFEVRHATFFRREVTHRRRQVDRMHAGPGQAHGGFGVEIEAAHEALPAHHPHQRRDRVNAKAVQRIANAGAQRLHVGPAVGHLAPQHANARRLGAEHRHAQHHGGRRGLRGAHELGDQLGRMLAVRIHGQRVGEALARGLLDASQHRRALAAVFRLHQHAQAGVTRRHLAQPVGAAVGAAIHHHPDRRPHRARRRHRIAHLGARVVAGDEYQVRGGGGRCAHSRASGNWLAAGSMASRK